MFSPTVHFLSRSYDHVSAWKSLCPCPVSSVLQVFSRFVFKTVLALMSLTVALSQPLKVDYQMFPLSMPLSMMWCPWPCSCDKCLKLLNTPDLPRRKTLAIAPLPLTPACPRLVHLQESWISMLDVVPYQSAFPHLLFTDIIVWCLQGCQPYLIPACDHHVVGKFPPCKGDSPTPRCEKQCEAGYNVSFEADKHYGKLKHTIVSW